MKSQKKIDEHLRNCRLHLPEIRTVFMIPPLERDSEGAVGACGIHVRVTRQKTLFTKRSIKACLIFAKKIK